MPINNIGDVWQTIKQGELNQEVYDSILDYFKKHPEARNPSSWIEKKIKQSAENNLDAEFDKIMQDVDATIDFVNNNNPSVSTIKKEVNDVSGQNILHHLAERKKEKTESRQAYAKFVTELLGIDLEDHVNKSNSKMVALLFMKDSNDQTPLDMAFSRIPPNADFIAAALYVLPSFNQYEEQQKELRERWDEVKSAYQQAMAQENAKSRPLPPIPEKYSAERSLPPTSNAFDELKEKFDKAKSLVEVKDKDKKEKNRDEAEALFKAILNKEDKNPDILNLKKEVCQFLHEHYKFSRNHDLTKLRDSVERELKSLDILPKGKTKIGMFEKVYKTVKGKKKEKADTHDFERPGKK